MARISCWLATLAGLCFAVNAVLATGDFADFHPETGAETTTEKEASGIPYLVDYVIKSSRYANEVTVLNNKY